MRIFLLLNLIVFVFCFSTLGQEKARYKICSEHCSDNKCIVYAFVAPEDYNEINMQKLAEELTVKYKNKEVVNLRVFDDEEIIDAYKKGIREPINILTDSRAYFIHHGCGDILFYKLEKDKIKVVKISWKNEKNCNEPFMIF